MPLRGETHAEHGDHTVVLRSGKGILRDQRSPVGAVARLRTTAYRARAGLLRLCPVRDESGPGGPCFVPPGLHSTIAWRSTKNVKEV